MALTKHDIVELVYNELGFSKIQSVATVEALLELIKASLESGEDILVSGFGKFCVKKKMSGKAGIRPPVRMPFFRQGGW